MVKGLGMVRCRFWIEEGSAGLDEGMMPSVMMGRAGVLASDKINVMDGRYTPGWRGGTRCNNRISSFD